MRSALRVAVAVSLVVLGVAAWLWLSRPNATPPPIETGAAPAGRDLEVAASSAPPTAGREAVSPPANVAALAVVVRGRCLAAEDDRPVVAHVRIGVDDGEPIEAAGALAHKALAAATTDGDGRFACTLPMATAADLRVHAESPARAPAGARERSLAPGSTWDLGDIRLARAAAVRGVVVDASGAPVADVEVGLIMIGHEPPALQFRESHTTVSDARGSFAFAEPVAAGEWYVRAERTGALRTPRKLQLTGEPVDVRIEVERHDPAQALHGRVVDEAGAPLAGVDLSAYGEGSRGRAQSGADGTFVLAKGPPHFDRGEVGIELLATLAGYEQTSATKNAVAGWGRREVVVVMRPLADVVVRAVDARGAPVWPFALTVGKLGTGGETWLVRSPATQRAVDGGVVLPRLPSGDYTLLLVPQDEALAIAGPVRFHVDAHGEREQVVRVAARAAVAVEVVDASGAPVPACTVELLASLTANPPDGALPAPDLAAARVPTPPGPRQVALAQGTTDQAGRGTLAAAPGTWLLRARCTTHQTAALPIVVAPGRSEHRLVLIGAAVVHGRLQPLGLLPGLGLGQVKPERRLAVTAMLGKQQVARAEVAADGTFALGPLPAAVVALQLVTWLPANAVSNTAVPHALGDVDGATLGASERTFDVAPFAPATVHGLVLWDGQPLRNGQFFLRRLAPEPLRLVRVPTDGDGRFRTLVPPGTLGPQLAIPSDPGPGHVSLPLDERHDVAAGGELELRIAASPRSLRLRVLQPDGAPLANTRLLLAAPGHQRPGGFATDAAGRVDVSLAPYGAFTISAKVGGVDCAARVDSDAGATGDLIDVLLAAAAK